MYSVIGHVFCHLDSDFLVQTVIEKKDVAGLTKMEKLSTLIIGNNECPYVIS